jgi:hypothetical protein
LFGGHYIEDAASVEQVFGHKDDKDAAHTVETEPFAGLLARMKIPEGICRKVAEQSNN